eukprot:UN21039
MSSCCGQLLSLKFFINIPSWSFTVGVKLLPPWFQGGLLDTSPCVRKLPFTKFLLDRSNRGGKVI